MNNIFDFRDPDKGFCWTTTPYTRTGLNHVPFIELVGYQQEWSAAISNINNWYRRIKDNSNPYRGLYLGKPANSYILPYLSEDHHSIGQNWQENKGPLGPALTEATEVAVNMAKAFLPAAGVLTPQSYAGQSPGTYNVTFNIINTNGGADPKQMHKTVRKNKAFLENLIKDNLHSLEGALTVLTPLIYEVYIPGIRFSPAAVISSLSVKNKGTMNLNTSRILPELASNYVFPDAWEVSITILELITESRLTYGDSISNRESSADMVYRSFVGNGVEVDPTVKPVAEVFNRAAESGEPLPWGTRFDIQGISGP